MVCRINYCACRVQYMKQVNHKIPWHREPVGWSALNTLNIRNYSEIEGAGEHGSKFAYGADMSTGAVKSVV